MHNSQTISNQKQEEMDQLIRRYRIELFVVFTLKLRSLDSRSRGLQTFATHAHEDAVGLRNQFSSSAASVELPDDRSLSLAKLERQKARWAASAKRLGKQLEIRTKEVHDLEEQLAALMTAAKEAPVHQSD